MALDKEPVTEQHLHNIRTSAGRYCTLTTQQETYTIQQQRTSEAEMDVIRIATHTQSKSALHTLHSRVRCIFYGEKKAITLRDSYGTESRK